MSFEQGAYDEESALDRLRRLRLARVDEPAQSALGPTAPLGPTGPVAPKPGESVSSGTAPVGQSPDARDRTSQLAAAAAAQPGQPVGPMGPQGPGTTGSASDRYTMLQALGSSSGAPRDAGSTSAGTTTAGGGGFQSPDAIARNNPAPPGFHWEAGRLVQDTGFSTIVQSPDARDRNAGVPSGFTQPSTVTGATTGGGGTTTGGSGAGVTGGNITGATTPGTTVSTQTGTTGTDTTTTGYKQGDQPLPGTDQPNPFAKKSTTTTTTDTTGAGGGGGSGGGAGAGTAGGNVAGGDYTGNQNLGGQGGLDNVTSSILSQINEISNAAAGNAPADVSILYSQSLTSLLQLLNQEEAAARAEAEKLGTQLDPATEFTLTKLREELDRNLKQTQMSLNARGLYDSGILVQAENDLRKGSMSDQAYVVSSRLSKIQDDLQKNLASLRERRTGAAQQYGLAGADAQVQENARAQNRGDNLQQMLLSARTGLRGQLSSENQAGLDRQQQAALAEQDRQARLEQIRLGNEFTSGENALDRQSALEQIRLRESYGGSSGGSSTAVGGGVVSRVVSPSGRTITKRADGTTDLGDEALQNFSETYDNPAMWVQAGDALNRAIGKLQQDGLTEADIQRLRALVAQYTDNLYRNAKSGYQGDTTGVTHGR